MNALSYNGKWSQNNLAKKIGTSREIISKYEKDLTMPSISIAKKIAEAFDVSLDYLAGDRQKAMFDNKTIGYPRKVGRFVS